MTTNLFSPRTSGWGAARSALVGLFLALPLLAAACNPGAPADTREAGSPVPRATSSEILSTGIRGLVLAGPTCPVERAGQSACVRPVSGASILALDSAGHEVGRAVSDSAGAYFLRLAPGTYAVVPQHVDGLMGVAPEQTVTVPDGPPVQLDLEYDTGIR